MGLLLGLGPTLHYTTLQKVHQVTHSNLRHIFTDWPPCTTHGVGSSPVELIHELLSITSRDALYLTAAPFRIRRRRRRGSNLGTDGMNLNQDTTSSHAAAERTPGGYTH